MLNRLGGSSKNPGGSYLIRIRMGNCQEIQDYGMDLEVKTNKISQKGAGNRFILWLRKLHKYCTFMKLRGIKFGQRILSLARNIHML